MILELKKRKSVITSICHEVMGPGSSGGKESACNAGDPSSIPGSGRSPGGGIGYLLQYSWPSLVTQMVKNPPAMRETRFRSLVWLGRAPGGWHDNPFQYSCLENPHGQRSLVGYSPWSCKESDTTERLNMAQHIGLKLICSMTSEHLKLIFTYLGKILTDSPP